MSRSSMQVDQVSSYMDGVHVKIAEAYKPPRKLTLPAVYNNKFPDVTKHMYDFSLERSVLEKLTEWRRVRIANSEAQKLRLEERKRREIESTTPSPPSPNDNMLTLPVKVAPAPKTTILTPQPLSPPLGDLQNIDINVKTNGLDYSDFDNDTSSPFDNVELKTINDMEELAQVLQTNSHWSLPPSSKIENILNELTIENNPNNCDDDMIDNSENEVDDKNDNNTQNDAKHRNISIIVEELQKELTRPHMDNWKPWPDLESPDCETKGESPSPTASPILQNPMDELSNCDKKLAKHLSDMGFPLSRSARAIGNLGNSNNKKIIEYLLAVQSLEELGLNGDDAEKALLLNQFDKEKAKKYYENLCTLKDLGFPEDEASKALLKCDIDRDKALDFLCA